MNKAQAKRYVYRLLAGMVEEHYLGGLGGKKPILVYDLPFQEDFEGRRLSKDDYDRVWEAFDDITEPFSEKGWTSYWNLVKDRSKGWVQVLREVPKVNGKPGTKWKGYKDWCKRQGRG